MSSGSVSNDPTHQTTVCVCAVCACSDSFKHFSHGLGDAHVALGRLRGDTAGGNQRLHWLVEKHPAENEIGSVWTDERTTTSKHTSKRTSFSPEHFSLKMSRWLEEINRTFLMLAEHYL